jgi:protein-disulfide isomerase
MAMKRLAEVGRTHWRSALEVVAMLAMTAASAVLIWAILGGTVASPPQAAMSPLRPRPAKPVPKEPVSFAGAPLLGDRAARVGVIEFSDYECPYCARFHQTTFPAIRASHIDAGKVLFAFRHLPLDRHPRAFRAAEAAECGARVAKFWDLHEALFSPPKALDEASIVSKAARAGIDVDQFRACLRAGAESRIEEDVAHARVAGVASTPSFLIGIVEPNSTLSVLRHESGAIPTAAFARILDDALKTAAVSAAK